MTTVTTGIHPAHAANMAAKAHRLATFLIGLGGGFADPSILGWLSDDGWERIADRAGEKTTPSPATRAATVALVKAMTAASADAFGGLPR